MGYGDNIAKELGIKARQVENTIYLLTNGATIPFIARYRKEVTGKLDEVEITTIRDRLYQLTELDKRRAFVIETITEQEKMTDELEVKISAAQTMAELEDLYLPYKPKRKTRASIAREKGLEPLAHLILSQKDFDVQLKAEEFINEEKGVSDEEEAIAGACDIIAEWINENQQVRQVVRNLFVKESVIFSEVVKGKEIEGRNYETYYDMKEPFSKALSHRVLAMFRGESEGFLKITIEPETEKAIAIIHRQFVKSGNQASLLVEKTLRIVISVFYSLRWRQKYASWQKKKLIKKLSGFLQKTSGSCCFHLLWGLKMFLPLIPVSEPVVKL
jgi:uncharacterized protein